jgi:hypothetical protein
MSDVKNIKPRGFDINNAHLVFPKIPIVFVLAGRALFAIKSAKTSKPVFYFIYTPRPSKDKDRCLFVYTKTMDDSDEFEFMGTIFFKNCSYQRSTRSKVAGEDIRNRAFRWFWTKINSHRLFESVIMYGFRRCARCGRPLKMTPTLERGVGLGCSDKLQLEVHLPTLAHTISQNRKS